LHASIGVSFPSFFFFLAHHVQFYEIFWGSFSPFRVNTINIRKSKSKVIAREFRFQFLGLGNWQLIFIFSWIMCEFINSWGIIIAQEQKDWMQLDNQSNCKLYKLKTNNEVKKNNEMSERLYLFKNGFFYCATTTGKDKHNRLKN